MRVLWMLLAANVLQAQLALEPADSLSSTMINENSGMVASRVHEGVLWTLNDSGDTARIFAVDSRGRLLQPEWTDEYDGLHLAGADNIDWEDIAVDDAGNLIIGAFGNNGNARRDLAIYVLPEPDPFAVKQARVLRRIDFCWPDQTSWPDSAMNHDCEACFFGEGRMWFLTKHRSDQNACLYRLDPPRDTAGAWFTAFDAGIIHPLTKVGCLQVTFEEGIAGLVTAADLNRDESRLAILSYTSLLVCEGRPGQWLEGKVRRLSLRAGQCESLCWLGDRLLVGNEEGQLFFVDPEQLNNN